MKKHTGLVLLFVCCVLLTGCGQKVTDIAKEDFISLSVLESKAIRSMNLHTPDQIQKNINKLAPVFAKAIAENSSLKELLAVEIGKNLDGQNEVLFDRISEKRTKDNKNLRNILTKLYGTEIQDLINSIPYFNISIPVNFEKWSTYNGPIYVIPMRYDISDTEIISLPGYDAEGNIKVFPADNPPDFPVIVIGINENVDFQIRLKNQNHLIQQPLISTHATTKSLDDGNIVHDEVLRGIILHDANLEAWYNQAAEIYCLYAVGENEWAIRQDYNKVDWAERWYDFNSVIFYYANVPNNMFWKLMIREADFDWGHYITFQVKGGFTWENKYFNIKGDFGLERLITNEDDNVGETQIYYYHSLNESGYSEILCGKASIRLGYIEHKPTPEPTPVQ